jgi:hypothetical protein
MIGPSEIKTLLAFENIFLAVGLSVLTACLVLWESSRVEIQICNLLRVELYIVFLGGEGGWD